MPDARRNLNIALVTPTLLRRLDYAAPGKPMLLDRDAPKQCWLCERVPPRAAFHSRAHVVPEALGNRRWITSEECDTCNHIMGSHESALIASTAAYRVTSRHGRRAQFRDPVTMARIRSLDTHNNVLVTETSSSSPMIEERTDREFIVRVPVDGYKPLSICKTLARLALLMRPELRAPYAHLRDWILGRKALAKQVLMTGESLSGHVFKPTVFIFQHDDEEADVPDPTVATLLVYEGLFYWYSLPKDENEVTQTFLDRGLVEQLRELQWKASFLTEESRMRAHHARLTIVHRGQTSSDESSRSAE